MFSPTPIRWLIPVSLVFVCLSARPAVAQNGYVSGRGAPRISSREPKLDALGRRLVGIVDNRTLTMPELEQRTSLHLRAAPKILDPRKREQREIIYTDRALADWAYNAALARLAERAGFTVTDDEMNAALAELSAADPADGTPTEATQQIRLVGIPEEELRRELHDALLIEKFMSKAVREYFTEEQMREVFKTYPKIFLEPTRVRAWLLTQPHLGGRLTPDQRKDIGKELGRLAKRMHKSDTPEELQTIQRELTADETRTLTDMGWVAEDERLPAGVLQIMFTLEPGKTSKPFQSNAGFHVVKVLERKEGDTGTFEEARPQVESYLFEKLKDGYYETAKQVLHIELGASGLFEKTSTPTGTPTPTPTPIPSAPTTPEPSLTPLRPADAPTPKPDHDGFSPGNPLSIPPPIQ